jgi:transaldolase
MKINEPLETAVRDFVLRDFKPDFGGKASAFSANPLWTSLKALGSELWLDTGSIDESGALWTKEFSALTTNNTLLNNEVQRGQYDALIPEACEVLAPFNLSDRELLLEIAFILNAVHGLSLVETYDAFVSVEEHTDLANDMEAAIRYGLRYQAICPERFIVKLPFTPAGLLATRKLVAEGVTINHTLGFSARQNYLIARIGNPAFVNVFMGRLNSFVADHELGDGSYVGEKATLASQAALIALRASGQSASRQIGASLRSGEQIRDLAGLDVFTMPPKAAQGFLDLRLGPDALENHVNTIYEPELTAAADEARISTLWDIDDALVTAIDALEQQDLSSMLPGELVAFLADHGCADLLIEWTDEQMAVSAAEGKIPRLETWKSLLAEKSVGLDSLMNLCGLNSFIGDQADMDERISRFISQPA